MNHTASTSARRPNRSDPAIADPGSEPLVAVVALMTHQHAVASDRQIRSLGVSWKMQQTLIDRGAVASPLARV